MTAADLRFYFSISLRWLPVALVAGCVTTAMGAFVAFALPPVYTSVATIVVEAPDLPSQLARSTVPENAIAQVQLLREELLTDTALAAMAETLDLQPRGGTVSDDFIETMRRNTALEQIHFGSGEQVINAFTVSYSAPDPKVAALVANKFTSLILANDLDHRQRRAAATLTFFREDVASLGSDLKASEAALLAFRNQNISALPESLSFRRAQIAAGQATLFALQVEEASARLRRAELVSSVRMRGQNERGETTLESTMLGELKTALAAQLGMFTPDSPSVASLQSRIKVLESGMPALTSNAVSGRLPSEVEEIDTRLAEIESETLALATTQAALEASLLATPGNETSLRTMELERDNIQSQYTAAVARLAEASTGERVETLLKGERLVLFQEALPPDYPKSPQRRLIVIASALAGLALVVVLAVAREMLNSSIRRPADLQRRLSMQPLGVIPYFAADKAARRRPPRAVKTALQANVMPVDGRPSWTI